MGRVGSVVERSVSDLLVRHRSDPVSRFGVGDKSITLECSDEARERLWRHSGGRDVSPGSGDTPVAAALAALTAATDALLGLELSALSSIELAAAVQDFETQCRRQEAVKHLLTAQVAQRGLAGEACRPSCADYLVDLLRLTPGEARARVAAAEHLGPRRALTGGDPLPPLLPVTAAGQQNGTISATHASVIQKAVSTLPAALQASHGAELEASLAAQAVELHPGQLARVAIRAIAMIDPDGAEPRDQRQQRDRDLMFSENSDGTGCMRGRLTPTVFAAARAALDPLAKPRNLDGTDDPEGLADPRTAGQRLHDAFGDAMTRLLKDGGLPDTGGAPTTLLVTIRWQDLRSNSGWAHTSHGTLICAQEAARLAENADLIPVFLNNHDGILSYGRTKRLATPAQRRAIAARDRGCSFPGCSRPPGWCEIHHLTDWRLGGETNIDQLTMLCGHHHRNHTKSGWTCQMINGTPHWQPPP